ncbi:sugar ABC transporter substrate-binding protein [Youhaiella tibetensis]|uniref:extracellular solute-binding protein n=1 Tax=Paradevosia tibetensis TaxID=1447062 RepID=UPI0014787E3A|nr:extracellular solute-binding protein [Youhaiella tibetensis]GGF11864.1 sugar ABC transporter substrate-binding protein [Youhaiella tibetensis]
MKLSALLATTALAAALVATSAYAETIKLYTWREQEIPLWKYISDSKVLGDIAIEVVQVNSDDYDSKIRIDLQSEGPDLFQGRAGAAWLSSFVDAGIVKPISTDLSGIAPAAIDAGRGADGQQYGVPFAIQMQSVIYNTKVLADNGIDVPKSMDEFTAAADKLKAAGIIPVNFGARSGWWLNQVVGETMTAGLVPDDFAAKLVSGGACFTDPTFVATLQTVKDWQNKGYINSSAMADDYGAMRTSVALGESAMMLDGVWSTGPTSPMFEIDPDLKMGFFPVPGANAKVYAFGDGTYLLNSATKHAEAAQKVLDFTATKAFAELFVKYVGELPAYGGEYTVEDPRLKEVAGMIAANSSSVTPFFAYALNKGQPSYGTLVSDGYGALLSGSASPEEVARKIQDGLNSWGYVGAANCK